MSLSFALHDIDGLVQERRNSIANALESRRSCINPSISWSHSTIFKTKSMNSPTATPVQSSTAMSVLTVIADNASLSICPGSNLERMDEFYVIHVADRAPELAILDNDNNSCIGVDSLDQQVFRLVTYIEVPTSVCTLQVTYKIRGMPCDYKSLVVYHYNLGANSNPVNQCSMISSRNHDNTTHCVFACLDVCLRRSVLVIEMLIQQVPGRRGISIRFCGLDVARQWDYGCLLLVLAGNF